MRELSQEEEAFIAQTLSQRESVDITPLGKKKAKRKNKKQKRFWSKLSFWTIFILAIPTVLSAVFIINLIRIQELLGNDVVKLITSDQMPSDFPDKARAEGFDWLPQYVQFYNHKEAIVAGMFTVAIVIIIIMFVIDAIIKHSRLKKRNAENTIED